MRTAPTLAAEQVAARRRAEFPEDQVKLIRSGAVIGAVAISAFGLAACGSDNNATSSTSGASASNVSCGGKATLKASGSTAQANAMTRFVNAYEKACDGHTLNYTSNGSGAGVSEFVGNQTDFGGSDSPLSKEKGEYDKAKARCDSDALNLPVVFGPIAVTYNVSGVSALVLDGPTLGKIFSGAVTKWDDPAITALNKGAALSGDIHVLYRSDESGTTDNFQKYLKGASDGSYGKDAGKKFNGGVGEGAKGNEGTSAAIKSTPGSITYNEWSFAKSQNLSVAKIVTSAGPDAVEVSTDTVGKTIEGAKVKGDGNDLVLDTSTFYKPTVAGAYPIVLATYEVVCSKYSDASTGTAVKAFLQSTINGGQAGLDQSGYIPIPDSFKTKLTTAVNAIS
jgi:phosphate transport system substrate-binding protein